METPTSDNPYLSLVGSEVFYKNLETWIQKDDHSEATQQLIEYHFNCRKEGLGRRILISYANLAREYERQNQLKPIEFNDIGELGIPNMVEYGRHIAGIVTEPNEYGDNGDLKYQFFYTIGNDDQQYRIPEILTFWPFPDSSTRLLNAISEHLISEVIQPLAPGESREINGLLGLCGEMPVRLDMLTNEGLKLSNERWTCQLRESTPVILLTIPDVTGYFPWDDNYKLEKDFPSGIINPSSHSEVYLPPDKAWLPSSPGAFAIELEFSYRMSLSHNELEVSKATLNCLREVYLYVDVDDEDLSSLENGQMIHEWECFCWLGTQKKLLRWLDEILDEFDEAELKEFFDISSTDTSEEYYKSKDEFLANVELGPIDKIIEQAYRDAVSGENTNMRRKLLEKVHTSKD